MKVKPEHIIISCEIDRDGYRGVTLRIHKPNQYPQFEFYTVIGGLQAS